MLPGVELARRRRVHYHGDVASAAAGAGEHAYHHHHYYAHAHHAAPAPAAGPALAARIRLEEKLRGAALPTSPSRSVGGCLSPSLPCFVLHAARFRSVGKMSERRRSNPEMERLDRRKQMQDLRRVNFHSLFRMARKNELNQIVSHTIHHACCAWHGS